MRPSIHRVSVQQVLDHTIFTNYLLLSELESLAAFFFFFWTSLILMAKSGLISDFKVNLRLFRDWYSLKRRGLSPSQLGRFFCLCFSYHSFFPKATSFLWSRINSGKLFTHGSPSVAPSESYLASITQGLASCLLFLLLFWRIRWTDGNDLPREQIGSSANLFNCEGSWRL